MKTILSLCLIALATLISAAPGLADTCNCAQTGVCQCREGQCMCPNCPGSVRSSHPQGTLHVYLYGPMVAVQQRQTATVGQYVCTSSGCYWVNGEVPMTRKERRAQRKLERAWR